MLLKSERTLTELTKDGAKFKVLTIAFITLPATTFIFLVLAVPSYRISYQLGMRVALPSRSLLRGFFSRSPIARSFYYPRSQEARCETSVVFDAWAHLYVCV